MPKHKNRDRFVPVAFFALFVLCVGWLNTGAQTGGAEYRIGERISYSIAFDKYQDVGYAELSTASRGKLAGKDAVELGLRIKTFSFFSAAFFQIDQERTTFVAPDTGSPLFASIISDPDGIRSERKADFANGGLSGMDLVSLIGKLRYSQSGTETLVENGSTYTVTCNTEEKPEHVSIPAGEYDVTVVGCESPFFTGYGIDRLQLLISNDVHRIPVGMRFRVGKGEIRVQMTSYSVDPPQPPAVPNSTPTPQPLPISTPRPKLSATPEPYVPNRPLASDLAFSLGEALKYRLTISGRPAGNFVLRARERKQIGGRDSLILAATVTNAVAGNPAVALNDSIEVAANPETLAPFRMTSRFAGALREYSGDVTFDNALGYVTVGGQRIASPVGTHSIISFLYAIRSFNLNPSKDVSNPVNDTRVAVFWGKKPAVFTLRPSATALLDLNGKKVTAQLISISTGIPEIDALGLKIWLSTEPGRVPLVIQLGAYRAELASVSNVPPM